MKRELDYHTVTVPMAAVGWLTTGGPLPVPPEQRRPLTVECDRIGLDEATSRMANYTATDYRLTHMGGGVIRIPPGSLELLLSRGEGRDGHVTDDGEDLVLVLGNGRYPLTMVRPS